MPALLPPKPRLTQRKARAKVKRVDEREKARPTPQQARERPRYPALARGVARQEAKVAAAMRDLRRRWLDVVERQPEPEAKGVGAKNIGVEDLREVDAAIEAFLTQMAGSQRSQMAFALTEDGLVQETNVLAHRIGTARGAEQVWNASPNLELTRLQRLWLNERAFERLSEQGRLRFEGGLDIIRDRMLEGFSAGENPLVLARELGAAIEGYESHWMRRLIRTEMAISSELAIREEYRTAGVRKFVVLGDPNTDALCVGYQEGGPYDLDNDDALPPYHPHCFDTISPYFED